MFDNQQKALLRIADAGEYILKCRWRKKCFDMPSGDAVHSCTSTKKTLQRKASNKLNGTAVFNEQLCRRRLLTDKTLSIYRKAEVCIARMIFITHSEE